MAGMHKRIGTSTAVLIAGSFVGASILWFWSDGIISSAWPDKEEPKTVSYHSVRAVVEEDPKVDEPAPKPEPVKHIPVRKTPQIRQESKPSSGNKPPSLRDKWIVAANTGGMNAFGKDNGYSGTGSGADGECRITQPVRVNAMIADTASTDQPGLAWGAMSEDVQGEYPDGTKCIAIHAMAFVSFDVAKAGDYATNRAPVMVGSIWMQDGFEVKVDQPGKHVDGSIGVVGKANHHVWSKTFAAVIGGAFKLLDNATSIGQYNVSSGEVTDPFEKMIDKTLNRPSTISFTGGKAVEFQVMPVSTPGYEGM